MTSGDVALDLSALYDEAPCGWFTMRLDGTVLRANRTLTSMLGRDLVGARFSQVLSAGGRIFLETHCLPLLKMARRVDSVALDLMTSTGQSVPVLLSAVFADGANGPLVHATVVDASDRRSYERELLAATRAAKQATQRLQEAQSELERSALHDSLTGLPNRRHATALLERALERGPLTVLFIDLDRFKTVNDTLGHEAGDALLRSVSDRLQAAGGDRSVLCRWGGDEFLLLLDDPTDATACADRLLAAVVEPVDVGRIEVQIGASIGMATGEGGAAGADALVRRADEAMYTAKNRGRNCYHVAGLVEPSSLPHDALSLVRDLREGIGRGELRLHFQPRVAMATGRVTGVEALVRWQHPQRGLIHPAVFVEVAERSGVIRDLDAWVLLASVRQAAAWNIQRRLDVAVNLSAPEISDPTLPDRVLRACQDFGLSPDRLTLEVTETALLVDTDVAFRNARSLRDAGVRLALDDFGTGYSGFTYLKRVPVDELKIDRSFVSGVASEPSDRAIVRGTIALAHELRLNVVAEGVETAEQDAALAMMGCDLAQGYLYLRPVSADDLAAFLPSRPDVHSGRSTSVA